MRRSGGFRGKGGRVGALGAPGGLRAAAGQSRPQCWRCRERALEGGVPRLGVGPRWSEALGGKRPGRCVPRRGPPRPEIGLAQGWWARAFAARAGPAGLGVDDRKVAAHVSGGAGSFPSLWEGRARPLPRPAQPALHPRPALPALSAQGLFLLVAAAQPGAADGAGFRSKVWSVREGPRLRPGRLGSRSRPQSRGLGVFWLVLTVAPKRRRPAGRGPRSPFCPT